VLEILEVRHALRGMEVDWQLGWGNVDRGASRRIAVCVDSETGPITAAGWLEDGLGAFPFRVVGAVLSGGGAGSGAEVTTENDEAGGILLRVTGNAAVGRLVGTLVVGYVSDTARTLRPALVAGVVQAAKETA
jgi:hypothetical protein